MKRGDSGLESQLKRIYLLVIYQRRHWSAISPLTKLLSFLIVNFFTRHRALLYRPSLWHESFYFFNDI